MKYITTIVIMLALSMQLYSQKCLRQFADIKWIEKRLELGKYNKHIKEINRYSNLDETEDRFAKYELIMEDGIEVVFEEKGCKEIINILSIVFDDVNIGYDTVISTIHLMSKLFGLPDNKILEIDVAKLSDNSKRLNNDEKITINTMMIGGFDKHETSFQISNGKFEVNVFILETYIIGD